MITVKLMELPPTETEEKPFILVIGGVDKDSIKRKVMNDMAIGTGARFVLCVEDPDITVEGYI